MKIPGKLLLSGLILCAGANLFIFINRNRGFEYRKFSNIDELYSPHADNNFLKRWTKPNERFTDAELQAGISLLKHEISIDTFQDEESKVIAIAGFLAHSFFRQLGAPSDSLSRLSPLQQYQYLARNKSAGLWCGHFQAMFGFFCTAMGLSNRYIELVPVNNDIPRDIHEVNEVYLAKAKNWVMVDVTRNILLVRGKGHILSAAQYLDLGMQAWDDTLEFVRPDTTAGKGVVAIRQFSSRDNYFNKNYLLRYYIETDLSKVYAPQEKIKRYILAHPWYEQYDPGNQHSNFLFRVKQGFIFLFFGLLLLFVGKAIMGTIKRKKISRNQK